MIFDSSGRDEYSEEAVGWVKLQRKGNKCFIHSKITPEHRVRERDYDVVTVVDEKLNKIASCKCQGCVQSAGWFSINI